ncbi:pyridoxal phosphate-dependent decarboxylase family protein [Aureispira anguillae]|uniref:Aspartate aminotransferase family protein n=1 Tax=Aureispira anguillae TaxID=2864201 RepID=A0A915YDT0_9BACT|nr:aspartate aminotransferase family protein [Aureispira anguillae]BDS11224.1 aspartate aminotransferase family protein [Aureispira anguillae]
MIVEYLPKSEIDFNSILDVSSVQDLKINIEKTINYLIGFFEREKFYSGASVTDLKAKMKQVINKTEAPLNIESVLDEIKELYLDHAISFHDKTYIAHLNCPVAIPAIIGDLLASTINTAVETWDQSTSGTLIEQELINWIAAVFQLPNTTDGVFTSGGTQSNFMGLLMARDHYAHKYLGLNLKKDGFTEQVHRFRIFCSEKAHYSIKKNAALLGLGYNAVVEVATDATYRMDAVALEKAIALEKANGNIPIAVVATTGTTDFGSIDPVAPISKIAKANKMWLHVDGAYGGCFVFTKTHKQALEPIKYADSITIDFHKTFFQPVCSSVFLAADADSFKYVSHYADYLNPIETKDAETPNLVVKSIQTTRRFDALKLWFTLRMTGVEKIAAFLEIIHQRALDAYRLLQEANCFELLHQPELSTVVFRYQINQQIQDNTIHDAVNLYIKKVLFDTGQASIASTKVNGIVYLKFTLLNPKTTIEDLKHIIELIVKQGRLYSTKN